MAAWLMMVIAAKVVKSMPTATKRWNRKNSSWVGVKGKPLVFWAGLEVIVCAGVHVVVVGRFINVLHSLAIF